MQISYYLERIEYWGEFGSCTIDSFESPNGGEQAGGQRTRVLLYIELG